MYSKYNSRKVYEYKDGSYSRDRHEPGREVVATFDSTKEYQRWRELLLLERAGKITGLKRQVRYELIPTMRSKSGAAIRGVSYVADFIYTDSKGQFHVEDAKGMRTEVYRIKKKLMLYVKGIEIEEV